MGRGKDREGKREERGKGGKEIIQREEKKG